MSLNKVTISIYSQLEHENNTGLVTGITLNQLSLLNHTWIRVTLNLIEKTDKEHVDVAQKFEKHEERKNDFVLQLLLHKDQYNIDFFNENSEEENKEKLKDGVIYVSALTFLNICRRDVLIRESYKNDVIVSVLPLIGFGPNDKRNFTPEFTLAQIACPVKGFTSADTDLKLEKYFDTPQLIQSDQIICVPMKDIHYGTWYIHYKVESMDQSNEAPFSQKTNAAFADNQLSKLYLCNPTMSVVPNCACVLKNNYDLIKLFGNEKFQRVFGNLFNEVSFVVKTALMPQMKSVVETALDYSMIISGERHIGKGLLMRTVCQNFCLHYLEENCIDIIGDSLSATEKRIDNIFNFAESVAPCVLYLKNVHLICKDKEGIHEEFRIIDYFVRKIRDLKSEKPVIVVGSTYKPSEVTTRLYSEFMYAYDIEPFLEDQRVLLAEVFFEKDSLSDENLKIIAKKTAGFNISGFIALFTKLYDACIEKEFDKKNETLSGCSALANQDYSLNENETMEIIINSIEELQALKSGKSQSTKIPKITWDDIGGLEDVKADIFDTIELPLKHPEIFKGNLRRSGLLFYGPPGNGKTLLAKAVATELTLNFYSVKGPELIDMYVGQSEENVRNVFQKARALVPCIIFFDELDSLAPRRGRSGDSGGVMDRIVSQLLAELDGIHDNADIFIIGATNRPDLLDSALLRPGRFDKMIYVGLPESSADRLKIFKAACRKLTLDRDVDLKELELLCPPQMTGADFSALASDAMMNCYRRLIQQHETQGTPLDANDAVICKKDFVDAIFNLVPSVSSEELARYQSIRDEIKFKK